MDSALSIDGVNIRLTTERWFHIVESHDELAGYYESALETVENPDMLLSGYKGSLIAARSYGRNCYLMVVYRQVSRDDGFIITAYFARKADRKKIIWKRQ